MSRNDWEQGVIAIPTHSWSKLKKGLQQAHNNERDRILKESISLQEEVVTNFKGRKNIDVDDVINFISAISNDESYVVELLVKRSLKGNGYQMKKITQKMLEELFPKATNRTEVYGDPVSAEVIVDNKKKTVSWYVSENNHAVETARTSWVGIALFDELKKIDFGNNKKLGGYFIGNDEINRDDGDGMNYVTARYGKKGELYQF